MFAFNFSAFQNASQVEFESPAHGNPEVDLLPVTTLALDHRWVSTCTPHKYIFQSNICRVDEDSDSECGDLEGQLALPGAFFLAYHTTMFVQNFFDHI